MTYGTSYPGINIGQQKTRGINMESFWKGFFSVFDFTGRTDQDRLDKISKQEPMQWYHKGPWWEHPIYGEGFKKKTDIKKPGK